MPPTSLPFYRKNQSLHDMEKERPKHMAALREAIINAASEVEENGKVLEREFNGGRRHEDEVRYVLPAVKHVMDTFEFTYINSSFHLEEIIEMTLEPSEVFRFDMLAATIVKDYHRKLIEFLPERFQELIEDLKRILLHLNMYCLSFCPPHVKNETKKKKTIYLETVTHYNLKRLDYAKTIQMHIDNIETMAKSYRTETGVNVKVFGLMTNELARRCDCGDVPFLLMFPEACFNVQHACAGIRKWVEADRDYDDFLRNDIERLEARKAEHSKVVQENRHRMGNVDYNTRATKREIARLETEMVNMARREKIVLGEIEKLEMDIKVMHIEMDYQEEQRDKIRQEAVDNATITEAQVVDKLDHIATIVADIRLAVPETRNKIQALKNKQRIVIDKRDLLNQKLVDMKELDKQKLLARGYMHEAKTEQEKIDSSLLIIKDIYLKRTSPDLTKKIFNSMPVQPRNLRHMPKRPAALRQKRDPLDRATQVVSKHIDNNWTDLYRQLPFYPERGHFDKDTDVDTVNKRHYRVDDKFKAKDSLEKWRKHNTVANVESLKETLRKMGRKDIIDAIDKKPPKPEKPPKAKAKQNWKKLKKLKFTIGKVLALQTQTHKSKLADAIEDRLSGENGDSTQRSTHRSTHRSDIATNRSDKSGISRGMLTGRSTDELNKHKVLPPVQSKGKVSFVVPKVKAY